MKSKVPQFLKGLGLSSVLCFSNTSIFAELLVDPTDSGNTNTTIYEDDDDYDDDDTGITLPSGLYFFGADVGGDTWYVSTNGALLSVDEDTYNAPITSEPGIWVFGDDLEVYEGTGQYIITSDNPDYFAVTWKIGTHNYEDYGANNFQLIWFKNNATLQGCSFLKDDIVLAYGEMSGVFNDNPPECGVGLSGGEYTYVTIPGASTASGEEGFIPSFDTLPGYVVFSKNGDSYDVTEDPCIPSGGQLDGITGKNRDMYQIDYFNTVIWSKHVPSVIPVSYNIYRDGQFLKNVDALYTRYEDHNLNPGSTYLYEVKAVDEMQQEYDTLGQISITTQAK